MKLEPVNIVCPNCGSGSYMRHLIGENVGYLDMKCINCNSYFNSDELYKLRVENVWKPQPITNADRIRTMSDEELADMFEESQLKTVKAYGNDDLLLKGELKKYWLDWLRQEVKEK